MIYISLFTSYYICLNNKGNETYNELTTLVIESLLQQSLVQMSEVYNE